MVLFERMNAQLSDTGSTPSGDQAETLIEHLLEMRMQFRNEKQWAHSDGIRDELAELGVLVEDGAKGSSWRWK